MTSNQYIKDSVLDAPKIMQIIKEMILTEHEMFKAACITLKGSAPLQYSWTRNSEPVLADSNTELTTIENTMSTLTIKSVESNHSGNYTCNVRNTYGHDQISVNLHVKGKP